MIDPDYIQLLLETLNITEYGLSFFCPVMGRNTYLDV